MSRGHAERDAGSVGALARRDGGHDLPFGPVALSQHRVGRRRVSSRQGRPAGGRSRRSTRSRALSTPLHAAGCCRGRPRCDRNRPGVSVLLRSRLRPAQGRRADRPRGDRHGVRRSRRGRRAGPGRRRRRNRRQKRLPCDRLRRTPRPPPVRSNPQATDRSDPTGPATADGLATMEASSTSDVSTAVRECEGSGSNPPTWTLRCALFQGFEKPRLR